MTDYIAYLEAQKKMIEQFDVRTAAVAADTGTEAAEAPPLRAKAQWQHSLAEALRAAASRLDQVPA